MEPSGLGGSVVSDAPRRGRPPGSRNKPKEEPPLVVDWPLLSQVPASTKLVVKYRPAFGIDPVIRETVLPLGWPVPQINDIVHLGGLSGRTQYVEYDYDTGTVVITLA
jgi:hypothetical protein